MLERLGVDFFLGIVGLASEFTPKVCSGQWSRLEEIHATGQMEFLGSPGPIRLSYFRCWGRFCVLLYDPGSVNTLEWIFSGCCGFGCGVHTPVLLRTLAQTGRNSCHWSSRALRLTFQQRFYMPPST